MAFDSIKSIEDFGYKFNEDGRLVNIQDGSGFNFDVSKDDKYNWEHYKALCEAIAEYVYELLQSDDVGLKILEFPQESFQKQKDENKAKEFIFVSEDIHQKDKLLVLVQRYGYEKAGQWLKRFIISGCLDHGTQIPYIKRAIKDGYGVVVTNADQNEALVENKGKKKYKSIQEKKSSGILKTMQWNM